MDHYFSSNPTSESNEKQIEFYIKGKKYLFITDNGVFSKARVDFATSLMINTIFDDAKGNVLDLGCGYGVIGITISSNPNVKKITMCDVNQRAIDLAKRNAEKNNVKNFEVIESDCFDNINDKFDTIVTNPPIRAGKSVIYKMYEDSKTHLNHGGILFLVINRKHGAPTTITFLKTIFDNVEVIGKKAGFNVIKCW